MTPFTDRETEMAAGSTWATAASDHNGSMDAAPAAHDASGTTSTDSTNTADTAQPVDGLNDILHDALGITSLQGDGASDSADPMASITSLLDSPTSSLLSGTSDASSSPLLFAGSDGTLQPVLNVENTAIMDVHNLIETLGDDLGATQAVHAVTTLGELTGLGTTGDVQNPDGHANLVTDVLNAPGDILGGDLSGTVSHLGADLSDVVNGAASLVNQVLLGTDPANPVGDIISSLGQDLQHLPLLDINGGNNADDGGLLGGIVGNLNSSSGGHLIDLDLGPQSSNGQSIDLLSQHETGPQHTLDVNAVDVGPGGPQLLDLGLLTGANGLNIPSLGGSGTDGLTGGLLSNVANGLLGGAVASGNTTSPTVSAPVSAPVNVDLVHDLLNAPAVTDHGILDTHGSHIL